MSECEEAVGPIEDGRTPSWIAFVSNDNVLIVTMYGVIERRNVVVFIGRHEMILVQFDRHSNGG